MTFYFIIIHLHSILRWILLVFLIYSIFNSLKKYLSSNSFNKRDSFIATLTVMMAHVQFLIGIILFFISYKVMFAKEAMSSPLVRFFTVEHSSMMLLAIACLTIGNATAKKTIDEKQKAKRIFIWFAIALIIMLIAIPWPFRALGSGWF